MCMYNYVQAVCQLYHLGFPAVGHIHSGNIFVRNGYILGGYENLLLGYRTSLYEGIIKQNLMDSIDVIMFGKLYNELELQCAI